MSEASSSRPPSEHAGDSGDSGHTAAAPAGTPTCTPEELSGIRLFRHLDDDELRRWSPSTTVSTVADGAYIYREGRACDAIYALISGTASAFREAVGMPSQMLRRIGPGDLFGLVDAFADRHHRSSVKATTANFEAL